MKRVLDCVTARQQLEEVFLRVIQSLPKDVCHLQILPTDPKDIPDGAVFRLTPVNPKCAPIQAVLDCTFGTYLSVGKGSEFEIPLDGRRYFGESMPREAELLSLAVVRGQFVETVVFADSKVVGASGDVWIEHSQASESWMRIGWSIFKKKKRIRFSYPPYS